MATADMETVFQCVCCVLGLLATVPFVLSDYNHTISVDPERGNDSTACLDSPSPSQPCRNLSYAFQPQYRASSTQYVLQPGTHYLNSTASDVPFTDLQDIAITGNGSDSIVRVVCFTPNAGLAFINVSNIMFENVEFLSCSSFQNSTSKNLSVPAPGFELSLTKVALYFSNCANVSMGSVHVVNSSNATGVTMYNTIGENSFTDCSFSYNRNLDPQSHPGGGGVYIEFSYCLPGDTSCANGTEVSFTEHNRDSMYDFTKCNFTHNEANKLTASSDENSALFQFPHRQNHVAFGRGGGLSIFFNGDATNNVVTVEHCLFSENKALWGGGIFGECHDSTERNIIVIKNSIFRDNNCNDGGGGGIRLGHLVYSYGNFRDKNQVKISDCQFLRNVGQSGGGLSVMTSRETNSSSLANVSLTGSTFSFNQAVIGAAMNAELFNLILEGHRSTLTIADCVFENNSYIHHPIMIPHERGLGTVYISNVDVHFRGVVNFTGNSGTALASVSAQLDFTNCTATFLDNNGINGGAIAMLGATNIIVNQSSSFVFRRNIASIDGGAIHSRDINLNQFRHSTDCFIAHYNPSLKPDEWNANFTFRDNFASSGSEPNAIFTTSMYSCTFARGTHQKRKKINGTFCWNGWQYDDMKDCNNYIKTAPGNVTVGPEGTTELSVYPGQLYQLNLTQVDDLNHPLSAVYTATPNGTSINGSIDPDYTSVVDGYIKIHGTPGKDFYVNLESTDDRYWHVDLKFHIQECPPGLSQEHCKENEDNNCSCKCDKDTKKDYGDMVRCESDTKASLRNSYWMGILYLKNCSDKVCLDETCNETGCLAVSDCPPKFCREEASAYWNLPTSISKLETRVCGQHKRRGILCGECIELYGPALNSDTYECVPCNITGSEKAAHAAYYILSVYVPLFLLFLAIIVFNIKLTTGPANAFILYSQVISSTFDLDADGKIPLELFIKHSDRYLKAYKFPYGIFNLEFFENFIPSKYLCLGTGLNALDIIMLEYVVAFFPLLMIVGVVLLYRLRDCCCRTRSPAPKCDERNKTTKKIKISIGDSLIPAFATFILLSYTKFSLASSYISVRTTFKLPDGYPADQKPVFYAGHLSTTDSTYIWKYYFPSVIIILTFVVIPPLMLLDYPLRLFEWALRRFPRLWKLYPKDKIYILLDAFQGCYKNKWRFFAGLYFLFRILINVTYMFSYDLVQFVLQQVYCYVFSLLVAFVKPYKEQYHIFNYVDSFIFFNLGVINLLTFLIYAHIRSGDVPHASAFYGQYILVFLPLIYMISYMVWTLLPVSPHFTVRAKDWMSRKKSQLTESFNGVSYSRSLENCEEVNWERARDTNRYNPILTPSLSVQEPEHTTVEIHTNSDDSGLRSRTSDTASNTDNSTRTYGSVTEQATKTTLVSFASCTPSEDDN